MRRSTLTSVLMALVLVLSVTAGAGTMAVAADDGDPTDDTETTEDDADDNETTDNETADNETDSNETDGNETLNESENSEDAFGVLVSAFVADLQENETNGTFGHAVASFVLANNPAADKIPDHAGPPTNKTQGPNGEQGPPEHAGGNDDNGGGGPPDHAGGPKDRDS